MLDRIKSALWAFRNAGRFNLPIGEWESYLTTLDIGEESSSGVRVNEQSATRQATVFSCINILARDMSALPLKMYERQSDGGRKEVDDHPLAAWLRRPNALQTPMTWRMRGWYSTLTNGNQYERILRNGMGEIQTVPIDPRLIDRVEVGNDLRKRFVIQRGDGTTYTLPEDKVLHAFGLSIDGGVTGVSPIRLCMETIGRAIAVNEYGGAYFRSPVPKLIAKTEGKLDEKARDKFIEDFTDQFAGKKGLKSLALMPFGITIDQVVKIPNNEAQFIETQKFSKEEIAQIYGMPMHRLQALDRATFSNIEHQGLEYVQYTLMPWLTLQEQAIERAFLTPEEQQRYFVRHNVDGLLRGDFKTRMEGSATAVNSGLATINERRALENLPKIEGGDDLLVQGAMIRLKDLKAPEPPPDPAEPPPADEPPPDEPDDDENNRQVALNHAAGIGLAEIRGAQSRQEIIRRHLPRIERALQKEIEAQGAVIRSEGLPILRSETRDALGFIAWLEDFVNSRTENVREAVAPVFLALATLAADQAGAEIKGDAELPDTFTERWSENFAKAFTLATIYQLRDVAIEAQATIDEDPVEAVSRRTEEWENGASGKPRAGKEAEREGFKIANAAAALVFTRAGYGLVWATFGKNCAFCNAMRGKRVSGGQPFLEGGDFRPEGSDRPMRVKRRLKNPPLHAGCDCMVVPG